MKHCEHSWGCLGKLLVCVVVHSWRPAVWQCQ